MCVSWGSMENDKKVSVESFSNRNPYVIVSFILGFLTGLNAILAGSGYYYAGWPAHGPVGILGIFLGIFGFLTILGSFLVLKKKVRIVGAVLVLVFGLISNVQEHIRLGTSHNVASAACQLRLCSVRRKRGSQIIGSAQSDLLHFTFLSTQAEGSLKINNCYKTFIEENSRAKDTVEKGIGSD